MAALQHGGRVNCCATRPARSPARSHLAPRQRLPLSCGPASNANRPSALDQSRTRCSSSASSSGAGGAEGEGEGVDATAEGGSAEDALQAAQRCIELFAAARKDEVVDFLPEAVIDRCLSRRGDLPAADLSFDAMLSVAAPSDFELDAFAQRALVLGRLRSLNALSTLRLSPTRCLQRYAVTTASGEEAVLTMQMVLQDSLEPRYRGMRLVKRWFLRGVTGEPLAPELPSHPAPRHAPESVVQAQLEALRCQDARNVFRFASAANRQQFADSLELFAQCLGSAPYRPLLGHRSAEVLRSVQLEADRALVIVGITSDSLAPGGSPLKYVFSWALALQGPHMEEEAGCWMVDAVHPMSEGTMRPPPA